MRAGPALALVVFAAYSDWFVHQPREWIDAKASEWPSFIVSAILATGDPAGDITDALGITGRDAVCKYDGRVPSGETLFAGAPVRRKAPAPDDIKIFEQGDFTVGWSPSLRHPAWCAYHVVPEIKFEVDPKRPNFKKDAKAKSSPAPSAYKATGYDRGHMAPNYAIASRYGKEMQKKTFLMSNIAPQRPGLNRGVWRDVEHRISKAWPRKWGEIWVITGPLDTQEGNKLPESGINLPEAFWQVVAAVKDGELRAFAVVFEQDVPRREWPTRHLTSIRDLEEATGLDFFPELERGLQDEIETQTPTRLWPTSFIDAFANIWFRGI